MSIERVSCWPYIAKGKKLFRVEVRPIAGSTQKVVQRSQFTTEEQAIRAAIKLREEMDSGFVHSGVSTLADVCEVFIKDKQGLVSEQTRAGYLQIFTLYLLPKLGNRTIKSINQSELEGLLKELSLTHRAGTLRTVATRIRMVFKFAESRRLISFNPAVHMRVPVANVSQPTQVQTPWSRDEASSALEAFSGHYLEIFVNLLIFLGLRKGEALGLRWNDVDLESCTLTIRTSRSTRRVLSGTNVITSNDCIGATKTRRTRSLRIPKPLVDKIFTEMERQARHCSHSGKPWTSDNFVVTRRKGDAPSISRVTKDFNKVLELHGLRRIRLHDLRHSAAVLSMQGGARLEATSQALGHSSTDFTKRTYARYVPGLADDFSSGIVSALGGSR